MAIYGIHDRGSYIELHGPGTVTTISEPEAVEQVRAWLRFAKRWAPGRDAVLSYIEYMIDRGQFEDDYHGARV